MKVMVLFGTRPEIIRLSEIVRRLDSLCEIELVFTGQNYDPLLSDVFFDELDFRKPDLHLEIGSLSGMQQIGEVIGKTGAAIKELHPDRMLVLGDTNSGLGAISAARLGVPVFHLEAGNRCYDTRVPEEINRRLIDHCSTVHLPYTHRSKENLLREGIHRKDIYVVGNPIGEVLKRHAAGIADSDALSNLQVGARDYILSTFHRAETVDDPDRLSELCRGLRSLGEHEGVPVLVATHPHTRKRLAESGLDGDTGVRFLPPLGFHDFVALEKEARLVVSDSGTVQEECTILMQPSVTIREVTERAETLECGANILSGICSEDLLRAARVALAIAPTWEVPAEYAARNVSDTVAKILLGHRDLTSHI